MRNRSTTPMLPGPTKPASFAPTTVAPTTPPSSATTPIIHRIGCSIFLTSGMTRCDTWEQRGSWRLCPPDRWHPIITRDIKQEHYMAENNERIEQFRKMAEADPTNEIGHFSLGRE